MLNSAGAKHVERAEVERGCGTDGGFGQSLQAMVADMQKGLRPEFFAKYSIAELQSLSSRELEWCGRLSAPLLAGPGDSHYRVIGWDEALGRIAGQMRDSGVRRDHQIQVQHHGCGIHKRPGGLVNFGYRLPAAEPESAPAATAAQRGAASARRRPSK